MSVQLWGESERCVGDRPFIVCVGVRVCTVFTCVYMRLSGCVLGRVRACECVCVSSFQRLYLCVINYLHGTNQIVPVHYPNQ